MGKENEANKKWDFTAPEKMPFEKRLVLVGWTPKYLRGKVGNAGMKIRSANQDGNA